MFGSMRLHAALAVAALAAAGTASAQIAINPAAVAGVRGPGGFTGVGAFAGIGGRPGGIGLANPYGLSTVAGNPYARGTLGVSPYGVGGYGLSTGLPNPFPYDFNPPFTGYQQDPYNGYLTGVASVTSATGQYWLTIQQAKLLREQARQANMETQRKAVELARWYESTKPKTQDLIDASIRTDLERARRDPSVGDVTSGKALNDLLNNVRKLGALSRGPTVSVDPDTLKHINLAVPGSSGNAGLLRDGGKFTWPLGLLEKQFDDQRNRLSDNIKTAVDQIKVDGTAKPQLLRDINTDLASLQAKVNDSQDDLSISQYLEARNFMRQLSAAVRTLSGPQAKEMINKTASGSTVAELIDSMKSLTFAPATPGDESAYMQLYYALRSFEAGLTLAQK